MNGTILHHEWYTQKPVNRDKTDFATEARMLGLLASVKAPALAATNGRAVAQLIAPWSRAPCLSCGQNLHMTDCHGEQILHLRIVKKSVTWRNNL